MLYASRVPRRIRRAYMHTCIGVCVHDTDTYACVRTCPQWRCVVPALAVCCFRVYTLSSDASLRLRLPFHASALNQNSRPPSLVASKPLSASAGLAKRIQFPKTSLPANLLIIRFLIQEIGRNCSTKHLPT